MKLSNIGRPCSCDPPASVLGVAAGITVLCNQAGTILNSGNLVFLRSIRSVFSFLSQAEDSWIHAACANFHTHSSRPLVLPKRKLRQAEDKQSDINTANTVFTQCPFLSMFISHNSAFAPFCRVPLAVVAPLTVNGRPQGFLVD